MTPVARRISPNPPLPRILVAEDDGEMRRLLVSALARDGYDVLPAPNGIELLADLAASLLDPEERRPDLIITDVRMPGVSGLDILAGLRADGWRMPVILITAFGDPALHAEVATFPGAELIDKPFDMDDLRARVRDRLGGKDD